MDRDQYVRDCDMTMGYLLIAFMSFVIVGIIVVAVTNEMGINSTRKDIEEARKLGSMCLHKKERPYEHRIENIQEVFFHQGIDFTLIVQEESGIRVVELSYSQWWDFYDTNFWECKLEFIEDVPENGLAWIYVRGCHCTNQGGAPVAEKIEIHVKSVEDVKTSVCQTDLRRTLKLKTNSL